MNRIASANLFQNSGAITKKAFEHTTMAITALGRKCQYGGTKSYKSLKVKANTFN